MSEPIDAMFLVVGHPPAAKLAPAAGNRARLEWQDGALGIDLETGAAIAGAPPAEPVAARLAFSATHLDPEPGSLEWRRANRRYWVAGGADREINHHTSFDLLAGGDDRLLAYDREGLHMFDRLADRRRTIVPPTLAIDDPVTGGSVGWLQLRGFACGDYIVIARSPAILVVRIAELWRGLARTQLAWRIRTELPLADPTASGYVVARRANREVRDRLWPPEGWASIAMDEGPAPFRTRPPAFVELTTPVTAKPLFAKLPKSLPAWMSAPTAVERFLKSLGAPKPPEGATALGPSWKAYMEAHGVACPDALVRLGDALGERVIYSDNWELLTPEHAEQNRALLVELADEAPEFAARSQMIPVFGADGDLLLLAPDGTVHLFLHDDSAAGSEAPVARSFDALLDRLARREPITEPEPNAWVKRYIKQP